MSLITTPNSEKIWYPILKKEKEKPNKVQIQVETDLFRGARVVLTVDDELVPFRRASSKDGTDVLLHFDAYGHHMRIALPGFARYTVFGSGAKNLVLFVDNVQVHETTDPTKLNESEEKQQSTKEELASQEEDSFLSILLNGKDEIDSSISICVLLNQLCDKVTQFQELRIFYSLANASFGKHHITLNQRNELIRKALEGASTNFRFDSNSHVISMLRLALDKAAQDGIIDQGTHYRLAEEYTKANVFADYRFQTMTETVQNYCQKLDSLHEYASDIDQTLQKGKTSKATIGVVCALIPIFGGIVGVLASRIATHVAGELLLGGIVLPKLEDIVDFSDPHHVQEIAVNHLNTTWRNQITDWTNKQLTDLVQDLTNEKVASPTEQETLNDLLPIVALLKVSKSLKQDPRLLPLDTAPPTPKPTSPLPSLPATLKSLRLSRHERSLKRNDVHTADDLRLLTEKQARKIGIRKIGELNRLAEWQKQCSS